MKDEFLRLASSTLLTQGDIVSNGGGGGGGGIIGGGAAAGGIVIGLEIVLSIVDVFLIEGSGIAGIKGESAVL